MRDCASPLYRSGVVALNAGRYDMWMAEEIFVSTDVEADGPIPGPHSMLSFGSAAFRRSGELIATFSANLELLPGASPNPKTADWWKSQPEAWAACRKDLQSPTNAMRSYVDWLQKLPGKPVFVGYPVAYDFMFVYWYLISFVGSSPFSHSALDIKTVAMLALSRPYRDSTKKNMPKRWFGQQPHTHVALDDAIGQGVLLCNILKELAQEPGA